MPLLHQVFVTLTMILLGKILTSPLLPCSLSTLLNGNNIMSLVLLSCDKWSSRNLAVNEMEVINLKMIGIMIQRCERESSAAHKSPCELNQILVSVAIIVCRAYPVGEF